MIDPDAFVAEMGERELFSRERNRVVAACSGGADSLCLLYLLWACREPLRLELSVLTCDHGLRPESVEEVREVRQRAWTLGLPCALRELDVPANRRPGESEEMAARRLRRRAYLEVAREFGADAVALGHHADDQAETVLLRLCRGTGPRGAGGMRWRSELEEGVELVRPLLGRRRGDLAETLSAWGVRAMEDASNRSRRHLRNRMRMDVLPLLEEINPGVVDHLAAFAEDQRRLEAWASVEAAERGAECVRGEDLRLEPWRFLPPVPRERVLTGWLRARGIPDEACNRSAFRNLLRDLERPAPHSRRWPLGGRMVRAEGGLLTLREPASPDAVEVEPGSDGVEWRGLNRRFRIDPVSRVDLHASATQDLEGELTGYVRMPGAETRFVVRPPRPGDRYRPLGMRGRVKVSDWFVNRKVPARLRSVWPVVECAGEIVWIPGFRVAETWRVQAPPCLRLRLEAPRLHTFCG